MTYFRLKKKEELLEAIYQGIKEGNSSLCVGKVIELSMIDIKDYEKGIFLEKRPCNHQFYDTFNSLPKFKMGERVKVNWTGSPPETGTIIKIEPHPFDWYYTFDFPDEEGESQTAYERYIRPIVTTFETMEIEAGYLRVGDEVVNYGAVNMISKSEAFSHVSVEFDNKVKDFLKTLILTIKRSPYEA